MKSSSGGKANSTLREAIRLVWCAAVDAITSPDFKNKDGTLNETAYLRYQNNTIDKTLAAIDAALPVPEKKPHEDYCDLNHYWSNQEDVECSCDKKPRDETIDEMQAIKREALS